MLHSSSACRGHGDRALWSCTRRYTGMRRGECCLLSSHSADESQEQRLVVKLFPCRYEKRLLLRWIHHFKSDQINNMDHMRISGKEPSSVTVSQRKWFQKLKMIVRKCQKTRWSQKKWCDKPTKLQSILIRKILILSKRYESTEVDCRTLLHVPSGS